MDIKTRRVEAGTYRVENTYREYEITRHDDGQWDVLKYRPRWEIGPAESLGRFDLKREAIEFLEALHSGVCEQPVEIVEHGYIQINVRAGQTVLGDDGLRAEVTASQIERIEHIAHNAVGSWAYDVGDGRYRTRYSDLHKSAKGFLKFDVKALGTASLCVVIEFGRDGSFWNERRQYFVGVRGGVKVYGDDGKRLQGAKAMRY